jgi:hypothetical protein
MHVWLYGSRGPTRLGHAVAVVDDGTFTVTWRADIVLPAGVPDSTELDGLRVAHPRDWTDDEPLLRPLVGHRRDED